MSRVPISPSCTTNYVGTLPSRKSHNYDGIRQRASEMSPLSIVDSHGPSHGYVVTNAFRKNDLMVASYPCNEGGMLDMCAYDIGFSSFKT